MNYIILIVCIIVAGSIETIRRLSDKWPWLAKKTSKIPYYQTISIAIALVTAICSLIVMINLVIIEIDKRRYSVFVVPESIYIGQGNINKAIIKIVNNKEYPIYQIDLKITVEEGDLSVDNISLTPKDEPKITSELKSESGSLIIVHDVFRIGTITKEGKKQDHFIIYDIDAHSTKDFVTEINATNSKQKSKVVFQIVRTDKKPTDIFKFDKTPSVPR